MAFSPDRRFALPRACAGRLLILVLLAPAGWLCAQQPVTAGQRAATETAPAPDAPRVSSAVLQHRDIGPGAAFGSDSFGLAPAGTKSSQQVWDQSLYDAFQPGAGFDRLTGTGERRGGLDSLAPFLRERRSGVALATGGRSATPDMTLLSLNPALRSGNSLRFSSTAGTLRFNEGLGGRGYYPVARMGPGAPLASFTSPNLGNSLMNFSASTYMGGSGYGAQKHTGPSISLRLNF